MSYKLVKYPNGELAPQVQRLSDTAFIPFNESNTDYQEYLEWVAAGNNADPAE